MKSFFFFFFLTSVVQEFSIFFFKFILFSQGVSLVPKMFLCGCVIAGLITRSLYMNPESCSNLDSL